jgi:hypothetical protein
MINSCILQKAQIKQINDFKVRVLDYVNIYVDANSDSKKILHIGNALADAMKIAVQDNNQVLYHK